MGLITIFLTLLIISSILLFGFSSKDMSGRSARASIDDHSTDFPRHHAIRPRELPREVPPGEQTLRPRELPREVPPGGIEPHHGPPTGPQPRSSVCLDLTFSSIRASDTTSQPSKAVDRSMFTSWTSNRPNPWIQLDVGVPKVICGIRIAWYNGDMRSYSFTILTSNNGFTFSPIFNSKSSGTSSFYENYPLFSGPVKYLRIRMDTNSLFSNLIGIKEIHVNGYNR
jgi:F5/8 type C domain